MAAVVRIKRALDEEPLEALVLSCKRRKKETDGEDPVEAIFKFAGTVQDLDADVVPVISNATKGDDVKKISRPVVDIAKKLRAEAKVKTETNRYKLVNYFRALKSDEQETDKDECNSKNAVTVLDVEVQQEVSNNKASVSDTKGVNDGSAPTNYVYDLYYTQPDSSEVDVDDLLLDGMVSFAPLNTELVFDCYRNNRAAGCGSDSDSLVADDDDDSNDENNWRNDYPDEEGGSDEDGEGLACGLGKVQFGDEELSSDGDDERLIYCEEATFCNDADMYGSAYAAYKKRVMRELDSDAGTESDSSDNSNDQLSEKDSDNETESRFE